VFIGFVATEKFSDTKRQGSCYIYPDALDFIPEFQQNTLRPIKKYTDKK